MNWGAVLILAATAGILSVIYMTGAAARFGLFCRIKNRWIRRLAAFGTVAAVLAAVCLLLSPVNGVIVLIHALCFFVLCDFGFWLWEKASGREHKVNWPGWLALALTVLYLSWGFYLNQHVWEADYELTTEKAVGDLRIAVLSDAHVGTAFDGEGFARHMDDMMRREPDIVLVAGDFVDDGTSREDMLRACEALGEAGPRYGVWFAYGNHDRGYYRGRAFSGAELAAALAANGVHVLEDETETVDGLLIVGRRDAAAGGRRELSELLEGADTDRYIVVMDHEPTDYAREAETAADLVVSGHTHGGQLFPINRAGEWLGLNDRTYGTETRSGTVFIVTSGISGWELRFKTGTRSEYVIIDVHGRQP